MKKKIILTVLLIFLTASASANILLEQPETDSDISDLEKEYRIGFINTGDQQVNLTVSGSVLSDIKLEYPDEIYLEPSEITSTPSQDREWYYLGEGNYAEIRYIDVKAEIPLDTDKRSHSFDLLFSRLYETDRDRPNVETVQEFNFDIFSTSDRIQTGFTSDEPTDNQSSNFEEDKSKETGEETGEQIENPDNISQEDDLNQTQKEREKEESGSVTGITILLSLGVILTMVWLLKEVFA